MSKDSGRVDLSWNIDRNGKTPKLNFQWKELDGPPVKQQRTTGFGSKLIREGLPKAKVDYRFPPTGVECDIELPLPEGRA